MTFEFIVSDEEKVCAYSKERTPLIDKIENLCQEKTIQAKNLFGYLEKDIVSLDLDEISYISIEEEKTIAHVEKRKYQIKEKISSLEEILGIDFIQINRYALVNIHHIARFDTSWNGNLVVYLKDGTKDFVSRRKIRTLKERIGIK